MNGSSIPSSSLKSSRVKDSATSRPKDGGRGSSEEVRSIIGERYGGSQEFISTALNSDIEI